MKNNEAAVFVFLASIVVGILISMNLSFGSSNEVFLNVEEYNEAYNKRNDLYKEVTTLMDKFEESSDKLNSYEKDTKNELTVLSKIGEEYEKLKMDLGMEAVEGEGIRITLDDARNLKFDEYYSNSSLVHDADLLYLINDLRNAGAEAIAINGHRIIYNTESLCYGTSIDLGGIKVVAPFYITAIGSQSVLNSYMQESNSYYKRLSLTRDIQLKIEKMDNIKVPAYNGSLNNKYIRKKR